MLRNYNVSSIHSKQKVFKGKKAGGQGGIRTLGNLDGYASLAGMWFQPTHPPVLVKIRIIVKIS